MRSYLNGLKSDAEVKASYAGTTDLAHGLAFAFYFLVGAVLDLTRGY